MVTTAIPAFFLYGEPLRAPGEPRMHVETIAARSRLHDWNIRPHRHLDLHQILFMQRGNVAAEVDGAMRRLQGPAVVSVPPGAVHAFRFDPGAAGLVATFAAGFVGQPLGDVGGSCAFLERATLQELDAANVRATDLTRLAAMLLREYGRSAPGRYTALRGLLAALLANVSRLLQTPGATDPGLATPDRELLARFHRQIEAHYRERLGIDAYAASLSVSAQRLRRVCLAAAGVPPMELVHRRLLLEAERQLRYTAMSVAKIGYHLGFEDPAYFTRFFSLRMRISPRAFRATESATSAAALP